MPEMQMPTVHKPVTNESWYVRLIKSVPQVLSAWVPYLYFLRFSILLWVFPPLLAILNAPSLMRSLLSGIVTPARWIQYLCVAFFLVALSFVALIVARVVVINGEDRFGNKPPQKLYDLLAGESARQEWLALLLSQLNTVGVFAYLYFNGRAEHVGGTSILVGLAAGTGLAAIYWYVVSALYYLSFEPEAQSSLRAARARTLLFPRSAFGMRADGAAQGFGDLLESASTPHLLRSARASVTRLMPRAGFRNARRDDLKGEISGPVYEGHSFSLAAAISFYALFLVLAPLTAPMPTPFWSLISLLVCVVGGVLLAVNVLTATPKHRADAVRLWKSKIPLAVAILFFAAAIPAIYLFSDAERFPIFALLLILITSLVWFLSGVAFFADRYRIPVLTVLLLALLVPRLFHWTGGREEHYLSTSSRAVQAELPTPSQILEHRFGDNPNQPLIVVTSTGGGIHAAAWTTAVLGKLEAEFAADTSLKPFHDHLLLLSTVSGGSSGLYNYLRELDAASNGGKSDWGRMTTGAQCSSLEAVGWGLVYYDIPKAVVPFFPELIPPSSGVDDLSQSPLGKDRTWALRKAFARNLDDPFCQLQNGSAQLIPHRELIFARRNNRNNERELTLGNLNPLSQSMPAFTMNTTTVEDGNRFLLANYQIPRPAPQPLTPPPAESFLQVYGGERLGPQQRFTDLPLATGAQLSATFPLVSSAARFPQVKGMDSVHFVDGGYYDNDGTASAIEFLREALDGRPLTSAPLRVLLIEIRNSPEPLPTPGFSAWQANQKPVLWNLLDQLMAPLNAFWSAGHESVTDRNRNALNLLQEAYKGRLDLVQHLVIDDEDAEVYTETDPLNWSLTPRQQQEVERSAGNRFNRQKYCQARSWFAPQGAKLDCWQLSLSAK
jgi:hypothetical protein